MKRFPCLVLDANIVIQLFQLGLWDEVVERCELILSETVVQEADFFVDNKSVEHAIDLRPDVDAGRIRVIALTLAENHCVSIAVRFPLRSEARRRRNGVPRLLSSRRRPASLVFERCDCLQGSSGPGPVRARRIPRRGT